MKICSKCKVEKEFGEFHKHKRGKNGIRSCCKVCNIEYSKQYSKEHPEEVKRKNKAYRETHPEKIKQYNKQWNHNNIEKRRQYDKKRFKNNRLEINRRICKNNRNRYYIDLDYKFRRLMSKRHRKALKGNSKSGSSVKYQGATNEEARKHIESTFKPGFTWENHGKIWHIDHITPLASFDLTIEEERYKAFNYMNLQALSVEDNLKKGSKILKPLPYKLSRRDFLRPREPRVILELNNKK